ncbi:hypothetical protein CHS0354_039676 [Potamilus streckersoni]|uniref:HAUS augmin-like complex subunit 2 n=1 Tax=Potamilus streckersoni TaxID=2493646 RepID=A0AAE0RZ61_9BIVA|nr:hypothetical protein CHS0354_039676 [Potamilus streckersoni]
MLDTSVSFVDSQNPWDRSDRSLAPLRRALILAERTGHIRKRSDYEAQKIEKEMEDKYPSLKLINVLREATKLRGELNKVNLEIQCRMQDKETSDITHLNVLESKIAKIKSLNSHLEAVTESKDRLISRLQQPFVGEYLKLEARYHKFASELFPMIAPLLSDLTTHLENIVWVESFKVADGKLESLLTDLNSILASLQSKFQALTQVRQSVDHLYQYEVSDHEHQQSARF